MILWKRFLWQCRSYQFRGKSNKACIVYISKSTNPYQNLAFESWMYERVDFRSHSCLFIWRSTPSVVIGRHQNPWKECNVHKVKQNQVNVCRRNSGGGAVYHDLGNANFTFFDHRTDYNRKHNLNLIVTALRKQWPSLDIDLNKRDDIILNQKYKISGSASKLGRSSTYHHCTLLINADKNNVVNNLSKLEDHISSNATASVRSTVINLTDIDKTINFKDVSNAVASSYIDYFSSGKIYHISTDDESFTPGICSITKELREWEWIYGKTPNFSADKTFSHDEHGLKSIRMKIKKGLISDLVIKFHNQSYNEKVEELANCLCDVPFDYEIVEEKLSNINSSSINNHLCEQILKLF